jgi:hypothetical protein
MVGTGSGPCTMGQGSVASTQLVINELAMFWCNQCIP